MRELYAHQQGAVDYIAKRRSEGHSAAFLWMEMRTGKTLSTIRTIRDEEGVVLVVCPKGVMRTWVSELASEGLDGDDVVVVEGSKAKRLSLLEKPCRWRIVNYDMVKDYDVLAYPHAFRIWDESRRLASPSAKVVKYAVKAAKEHSAFSILLSGTPASEGHHDLVSQYLVAQGDFMGYERHMEYLVKTHKYMEYKFEWVPLNKSHVSEVKRYVAQTAYSVKMSDVGLSGTKLRTTRRTPSNAAQEALLAHIRYDWSYERDGETLPYNSLVRASFERQVAAGFNPFTGVTLNNSKVSDLKDYIVDVEEPMLILSEFLQPLEALDLCLGDIPRATITGATPTEEREVIRKEFQNGMLQIVMGQVQTLAEGLDFSRATHIVYLSNSYSQYLRTQSEERATKVGKMDAVQIVDCVCSGTIEEDIVPLLAKKQDISRSFLDDWYDRKAVEQHFKENR